MAVDNPFDKPQKPKPLSGPLGTHAPIELPDWGGFDEAIKPQPNGPFTKRKAEITPGGQAPGWYDTTKSQPVEKPPDSRPGRLSQYADASAPDSRNRIIHVVHTHIMD
jgi:hypothetical protein